METLLATVPLACKALGNGKLAYWEIGNEPDLFKTTTPNSVRPPTWTESDYVTEWLERERAIRSQLKKSCPEMATDSRYKYIAPSFAGLTNSLDAVKTWQGGINKDKTIALNSMHKYDFPMLRMPISNRSPVTLAGQMFPASLCDIL